MVASGLPPPGDLARKPGTCPDWEWNPRPFPSESGVQSTEPGHAGLISVLLNVLRLVLWPGLCSILVNVSGGLGKDVFSTMFL